ncbi:MAG: PilN domain-containing protein [Nitrospirales bacterium]
MTPRIRISLSAPGIDSLLLAQWGLTLLTVGCIAISGCIWWYSQTLVQESEEFEQQTQALQSSNQELIRHASSQGIDLSNQRIQALPKEVKFAHQLRKQLGFSWTQFLNDLESSVPTNIAMESVNVNFKEVSIALNGSAKTLADINRFVDRLETHASFHHVVLSQHALKRKKKSDAKPFVLFTLTVLYEANQRATLKS